MRSASAAKRKTIARDLAKPKSLMQSGHSGYGNTGVPAVYTNTHALFDDISLWTGFSNRWSGDPANIDLNGWPLDDAWQKVFGTDMIGSSGVYEVALFKDCEFGGFMVGRYKSRVQWSKPAIKWHPDFWYGGRIVKDVTLEDGYTHEFTYEIFSIVNKTTGLRFQRHMGFVGANGIGITDLVLPKAGVSFEELENRYFAKETLDYYTRYRGLRLMEFSQVNNYGYNVTVTSKNIRKYGIPSMEADFHPESAGVKGGWGQMLYRTDPVIGLTQETIGIPVDLQVQFLNELYSTPGSMFEEAYLHIPIQCNNEAMETIFRVYAKHLNPNIKVYFELGNEVWNFSFKASNYAMDMANNLVDHPDWNLAFNGDRDLNNLRQKYLAAKAADMMTIAQRVWREEGKSYIPMGVMAGMYAIPTYFFAQMQMIEYRTRKKAKELFKGIAIAPYFGPSPVGYSPTFKGQTQSGKTKEEYLHIFRQTYLDYHNWFYPEQLGGIKYIKMLAQSYDLDLWVYEAGYDYSTMTANNGYDTFALVDALLDPEMSDIVYDFQVDAYKAGIDKLFWYKIEAGTWYKGTKNAWFQFCIQDGSNTPISGIHRAFIDAYNSPTPGFADMMAHNKVKNTGGVAKYSARTSSNKDYWRHHGDNFVLYSQDTRWFPNDPSYSRLPEEVSDDGAWYGNYVSTDFYRNQTLIPGAPARWVMFPIFVEEAGKYKVTLWGGGGGMLKGKVHNVCMNPNGLITSGTSDVAMTIDQARTLPMLDEERCGGVSLDIFQWNAKSGSVLPSYLGEKVAATKPAVGDAKSITASTTPFELTLPKGWSNITVSGKLDETNEVLRVVNYTSTVFWIKVSDTEYYLADRNFVKLSETAYTSVDALPYDIREELYPWVISNEVTSYDGLSIGMRSTFAPYFTEADNHGFADFTPFYASPIGPNNPTATTENSSEMFGYIRTNSAGKIIHAVVQDKGSGFPAGVQFIPTIINRADGTPTTNVVKFTTESDKGVPLKKGGGRIEIVYEYDSLGRLIFNEDGTKKIKTKRKMGFNVGIQKLVFERIS